MSTKTAVTYGGYKFDFWFENKKDQHYELNQVSLIEKFNEWLPKKEKDWLEYYGSEQSIRYFITDKQGLSSVFNEKQFAGIVEVLRPIFLDYTYPKQ